MTASKQLLTGDMIKGSPAPKTAPEVKEVMNFRVSPAFRKQMRQLALDRGMNLSELLVAAVTAYGKGPAI